MKRTWIIKKEVEQELRGVRVKYTRWWVVPNMWIYPRPGTRGYRVVETEQDLFELSEKEIEKMYNTGILNNEEEQNERLGQSITDSH